MLLNLTILLTLLSISNFAVTVYLHRVLTHRSVKLHPFLNHFFRIALWILTPFPPKLWVGIHRYHHHTADTHNDPHSPLFKGIIPILINGAFYHIKKDLGPKLDSIIELNSKDLVITRLEEFYLKHSYLGKVILLLFILSVTSPLAGFIIWSIVVLWPHLMAERIHVVFSHYIGNRNFDTKDNSRNIIPWALILFGEELHNNHHAKSSHWSFRAKWYEIDPGAIFIQLLLWTRLAHTTRS